MENHRTSDWLYWTLAILFGIAAGFAHIRLNDSGLSVLVVTGATMFLAYKRPTRIWRWAIVVGLSLPLATVIAHFAQYHPTLGMVVGSFAGTAFAIVGAIGGMFLRRVVTILFAKEETHQSR